MSRKKGGVVKCEECKAETADHELCEECCSHDFDPDEGFMCTWCGKEGAEDVMARAYDDAKDRMKYGE